MFTYCFITNVKSCNRHCLYYVRVVLFPDSKYGFYRSILVLLLQIQDLRGMLLLDNLYHYYMLYSNLEIGYLAVVIIESMAMFMVILGSIFEAYTE